MIARITPIRVLGLCAIGLAFIIGYFGYQYRYITIVGDFYANVAVDLASIAIAVLVMDYLSERREKYKIRNQYSIEAKSDINEIACHAVEKLRENGWLENGSLRGINLLIKPLVKSSVIWGG